MHFGNTVSSGGPLVTGGSGDTGASPQSTDRGSKGGCSYPLEPV